MTEQIHNNNKVNNNDIFFNMNKLPIVLIDEIKTYISIKKLIFTNTENYITNHILIRNLIPILSIENYIRNIICRDLDFVFKQILQENYIKWFKITDYRYKNIIYKNYIYFIKDFCIEHNSEKCRNMINNFLEELGLCKNQHKKNINKHIRWKI